MPRSRRPQRNVFTIILTVILIVGPGKEDVSQAREMTSLDECWDAARAWVYQDAQAAGAQGFAAGCSVTEAAGRKAGDRQ